MTEQLLRSGSECKLLSLVSLLPAYCLQLGFVKAGILFWIYKQDIKFYLGWLYYICFIRRFSLRCVISIGASELHVTITCRFFKLIFFLKQQHFLEPQCIALTFCHWNKSTWTFKSFGYPLTELISWRYLTQYTSLYMSIILLKYLCIN